MITFFNSDYRKRKPLRFRRVVALDAGPRQELSQVKTVNSKTFGISLFFNFKLNLRTHCFSLITKPQ
jgi:hypothetical protein